MRVRQGTVARVARAEYIVFERHADAIDYVMSHQLDVNGFVEVVKFLIKDAFYGEYKMKVRTFIEFLASWDIDRDWRRWFNSLVVDSEDFRKEAERLLREILMMGG